MTDNLLCNKDGSFKEATCSTDLEYITKLETALQEIDGLINSGEVYVSEFKRIIKLALAKEEE